MVKITRYLQGFLLLGFFYEQAAGEFGGAPTGTDISVICGPTGVTLNITQGNLDAFGIAASDNLIIHNTVQDDLTGIAANCIVSGTSAPLTRLVLFDECNVSTTIDETNIKKTWRVFNVESSDITRKLVCQDICCTYPRMDKVTGEPVNVTLTKVTFAPESAAGEMSVTLTTYSNMAGGTPSTSFIVPATIYVRVAISGVPNSYYVQIQTCDAVDSTGTANYSLIALGVSANTAAPDRILTAATYTPLHQDFQFNSFEWFNPALVDTITIRCTVYLCNSDDGTDCTTMLAPVGTRRRRNALAGPKSILNDSTRRVVTSKPIIVGI